MDNSTFPDRPTSFPHSDNERRVEASCAAESGSPEIKSTQSDTSRRARGNESLTGSVSIIAGTLTWLTCFFLLNLIYSDPRISKKIQDTGISQIQYIVIKTVFVSVTYMAASFVAARIAERAKLTHGVIVGAVILALHVLVVLLYDDGRITRDQRTWSAVAAVIIFPIAFSAGALMGRFISPIETADHAWKSRGVPQIHRTLDGKEIEIRPPRDHPILSILMYTAAPLFYYLSIAPNSFGGDSSVLALFLMGLGTAFIGLGRRLRARPIGNVLGPDATFYLYLRPFEQDTPESWWKKAALMTLGMGRAKTQEVQLCASLGKEGTVVAVGRPDESIPPMGAVRVYVQDADWQDFVTDLMKRSRAIILRAGLSGGLEWELQQALRVVNPEKLLFFLPLKSSMREGSRKAQYDRFRNLAERALGKPLPETLDNSCLIIFDQDRNPIAVPQQKGKATLPLEGCLLAREIARIASNRYL
jgi:hypothetical protein